MADVRDYNAADETFVKGMIPHHEMAVAMAKTVLEGGENAAVAGIAGDIVKNQSAEIEVLKAWLDERDIEDAAGPDDQMAASGHAKRYGGPGVSAMDYKYLDLDWKADDSGHIEGYGSVFDTVDQGGDIVAPGAFRFSLGRGRKVKMLYQHDPSAVIGVWNDVVEDGKGLRVKGQMLTTVKAGQEAYELVKAGAIDGLSIGYRTVKSMDRDGKRVILQADLYEVSLVTFPMNEMARVDAVKAADLSRRDFERLLTQDAGLARSVARQLMAGGYDAIKATQDAGDGIEELMALLKARCNL